MQPTAIPFIASLVQNSLPSVSLTAPRIHPPLTIIMSTQYITPTLSSDTVQVDPNNPGTVFRVAAALEASFNILGATVMFCFPRQLLSYSVNSTTAINSTTTLLVQILGLMVYGLTPQLVAAIPQTRTGIQSRPTV